ncbi:mucin-3B [Synchiropus splendidus]|uniref:mucin-3B n=1 Tax=Synchiropus splendidus TaxID=270530 RepID=UPI00237D6735|nr:mucin-3B [Synchiropus splendidus]
MSSSTESSSTSESTLTPPETTTDEYSTAETTSPTALATTGSEASTILPSTTTEPQSTSVNSPTAQTEVTTSVSSSSSFTSHPTTTEMFQTTSELMTDSTTVPITAPSPSTSVQPSANAMSSSTSQTSLSPADTTEPIPTFSSSHTFRTSLTSTRVQSSPESQTQTTHPMTRPQATSTIVSATTEPLSNPKTTVHTESPFSTTDPHYSSTLFTSHSAYSTPSSVSNPTPSPNPSLSPSPSPSTIPQCGPADCQCVLGVCRFSQTLGRCQCYCPESVFGDACHFGDNSTSAYIDPDAVPTRKTNITLKIDTPFLQDFYDLLSPKSVEFSNTLLKELQVLCKEADARSFNNVKVFNLSPGSVVAESIAEYNYLNNATQIHSLNTELVGVLTDILNDTRNLNKISEDFGNVSVQLNLLTFQSPAIQNITDLLPFVNCSRFTNYTAELIDGRWQCAGHCRTNPGYCHQNGQCLNHVSEGPICRCYKTDTKEFYGARCNQYRWGPGFYAAVFGSLAAVLLIVTIIVVIVIVRAKHSRVWKLNRGSNFEEEFFDFSHQGRVTWLRL